MTIAGGMTTISGPPWAPAAGLYPHWYAVYTYPRHEKSVADHLQISGVEAFLPTCTTVSQWKDRRVAIESPVFPGYVFFRAKPDQRGRVLNAPGAIRILSFGGVPAPIDDSEIEGIKLCVDLGVHLQPCSVFEVGDLVRVRSGLLEGLEGRISQLKNKRRLIVPITLINQSMAVEVDVDLLEFIEVANNKLTSSDPSIGAHRYRSNKRAS
jgi:transcription antitermination factor NusG